MAAAFRKFSKKNIDLSHWRLSVKQKTVLISVLSGGKELSM